METTYPNVFPCTVQYEDERESHAGAITEADPEDAHFLVEKDIKTIMIVDEPHFLLTFQYNEEGGHIDVPGHSKKKPIRDAVAEGVQHLRMIV